MTGIVTMKGHKVLRTDQGCAGVLLSFVRQHLECIKLCLWVDSDPAQCLWLGPKGRLPEMIGISFPLF